jgi:WD40 repeat protein
MPTLSPCPDRRDLEQFLLGHGDAERVSRLEEHLSECPECATVAGQVAADDELVNTVRRAGDTQDTPEPESVESLVSAFRMVLREHDPGTVSYGSPMIGQPVDDQATPTRLGGYEVRGVLGRGGMGVVYHGFDPVLRREVAIKVVKREWHNAREALERFIAEARSIAAVEHDNIVVVHAVEMHDGRPCLVMPLLRGESLAARFAASPHPLQAAHLTRLAADVLSGLAAAHARGLIHRDIKPANLWVEPGHGFGRVKVLDFGLAVAADEREVGMGGTPGYMAPEQINGRPMDGRTDLFALGCVLYRAAAGQGPFDGTTPTDCLVRTITRDPQPVRELNPSLPVRLAAFIDRLLARVPDRRPASAEVALAELHAIEKDAAARKRRMTRRGWLAGVGVAAVLGGFGAWLLSPGKPPEVPPVAVEFTHDPDVTKLILSRDGQEQVVALPNQAKQSLPPGEYHLRLPEEVPGRKLEPASITVLPDSPIKVAVSLPGQVAVSKAHDAAVTGVVALPGKAKDGLRVVSAGLDRTMNSWDVGSKDAPAMVPLTSPARAFAATPDGLLVLTAGGNKDFPLELGVQLWDGKTLTANGPPLEGHTRLVTVAAVAADGSRVVSAAAGEVWLRTLTVQRREQLVGHGDATVTTAAVDAAGKFALTGDDAGCLIVWDTATASMSRKVVAQGAGEVMPLRAVGFVHDGFVSTGDDGLVRVWDRTTFKARELGDKAKAKPQRCLAVSADGKRLLCGGADGTITVWSVADGTVLTTLTGHQGTVNAVAFTPDGKGAVSAGADRTVRVWRLPLP